MMSRRSYAANRSMDLRAYSAQLNNELEAQLRQIEREFETLTVRRRRFETEYASAFRQYDLQQHRRATSTRFKPLEDDVTFQEDLRIAIMRSKLHVSGPSLTSTSSGSTHNEAGKIDHDPCPICLEDMTSGSFTFRSCGHKFHATCDRKWKAVKHGRSECPMCRRR